MYIGNLCCTMHYHYIAIFYSTKVIYIYIYIYIHTHTHTHMGVCMLITNIDMSVSQPMANLNPGLLNYSYSVSTRKKIFLPEENMKFSTENRYNYIYNVPLVFCTTSCSIKTC